MKYSRWKTGNVSRWSNRTEDIAVDALGFILSRSRAARTALRNIIETAVQDIGELTGAKTQVTGDDGARPDLVVFGRGGKERVIVEAKFWAELTENQPGTYLARLPDDNAASALLFVAPEKRLESLWIELRRRMQYETVTSTSTRGYSRIESHTATIRVWLLPQARQRGRGSMGRRMVRRQS